MAVKSGLELFGCHLFPTNCISLMVHLEKAMDSANCRILGVHVDNASVESALFVGLSVGEMREKCTFSMESFTSLTASSELKIVAFC